MNSKRSINVTLRVSGVSDESLESIKRKAEIFRNDVANSMGDVDAADGVYFDFSISDSEWIDPEYDDPDYMTPRRRRPRKIG